MPKLTRRRRLLILTTLGATVFVATGAVVALRRGSHAPVYRPGEADADITSDLTRNLPSDYPRVRFSDATAGAGISFRQFSGTRSSQLPEDMGSGAAWADYDNDGWLDLAIANEAGPLTMTDAERAASPARVTLYQNRGDGTFLDVTTRAGIDLRAWAMAVAWADYDNDGHRDLLVTTYGTNHLFHNEGDGTFTERSVVSGIAGPRGFWTGAAWGDYDRDGYLDLYITGYVRYERPRVTGTEKYDVENPASINPSSFRPERNLLYHNNRDGTFTEVARHAGVVDTLGRGLAAAWVDFDEDGWPDLYVANDVSDNVFYRNRGDGTFQDLSHAARVADYRSAMGIAVGDWDADGDQDMFLTHWLAQEDALYSNQLMQLRSRALHAGGGAARSAPVVLFSDDADRNGLGQSTLDNVGWGTSFVDYDNDGTLDLFVVNGSTLQNRDDTTHLVPERNQLFWNRDPREGFYDVSAVAGPAFAEPRVGRGAAFGDYDNDGDVDVFIVNHDAPGLLLRNDGGNARHWLQVELRGTHSNRDGIGARIRVVHAGGRADVRQVGAQASYLSQNSLVETFGLGAAERVDSVEVTWPSGARDVRIGVHANQRLTIIEGGADAMNREQVQAFWSRYREATNLRLARDARAAASAYASALAINPRHEDALYYLGAMRLEIGDYAAASVAWHDLLDVNPASARTHSQLGMLYSCLDRGAPFQLDSAARHLERAHEINREENGPLVRLGEVALLRGDAATARHAFETVLATNARSAGSHFYLGYLAWAAGDAAAAQQQFARALETSAPAAVALSGEGDTKHNAGPLTDGITRCGQLRNLSDRPSAAAGTMAEQYARVRALMAPR
jgi:enediyne biosynthesis protein E4